MIKGKKDAVDKAFAKLEQIPYVERYAWFSGDIAALYAKGKPSELNRLGNTYRQF